MMPNNFQSNVTIAFYVVPGRMGRPDVVYPASDISMEFVNPAKDKHLLVGERVFHLPFVRIRKANASNVEYAHCVMPCHFSPDWSSIESYEQSTGTNVIMHDAKAEKLSSVLQTSALYWVALATGQIFEVQRPSLSNIAIFKPTSWVAPVPQAHLVCEELSEA